MRYVLFFMAVAAISVGFFQNCGQQFAPLDLQTVQKEDIEREALTVLQNRCAQCHSSENHSAPKAITDKDRLILEMYIIPGDPDQSVLYQSLYANMPLGGPPLGENEKALIRRWIEDLGGNGTEPEPSATPSPGPSATPTPGSTPPTGSPTPGSTPPTGSPTPPASPTPMPTPPVTMVYFDSQIRPILQTNCVGCHSALSSYSTTLTFRACWPGLSEAVCVNPGMPPRNGSSIVPGQASSSRFLIRVQGVSTHGPVMGNLSAAQIELIRNWINQGAQAAPGGINQSFRISLADRHYLASVLRTVYSRPEAPLSSVATTAIRDVQQRADLFGGPCHVQDLVRANSLNQIVDQGPLLTESLSNFSRCHSSNTEEARLNALLTPESGTVSESFRMSACLRLSSGRSSMEAALTNAGLTHASEINEANIKKMFSQFYPGREMGDLVRDSLLRLGTKAEMTTTLQPDSGFTRRSEGWRFINLALCLSPGWMAP